jgi:hypothetical protein
MAQPISECYFPFPHGKASYLRVPEIPPFSCLAAFSCGTLMLEIAISLILGLALGYGVREWAFRRDHSQQRRRRPF